MEKITLHKMQYFPEELGSQSPASGGGSAVAKAALVNANLNISSLNDTDPVHTYKDYLNIFLRVIGKNTEIHHKISDSKIALS